MRNIYTSLWSLARHTTIFCFCFVCSFVVISIIMSIWCQKTEELQRKSKHNKLLCYKVTKTHLQPSYIQPTNCFPDAERNIFFVTFFIFILGFYKSCPIPAFFFFGFFFFFFFFFFCYFCFVLFCFFFADNRCLMVIGQSIEVYIPYPMIVVQVGNSHGMAAPGAYQVS